MLMEHLIAACSKIICYKVWDQDITLLLCSLSSTGEKEAYNLIFKDLRKK